MKKLKKQSKVFQEAISELNELTTLREVKISYIKALEAKERLILKDLFSSPGGLYHFVKYFFHITNPADEFIDGWHIQAICDHLEATADGRIKRLLINICPRSMKSLLCSVFFPLWLWTAKNRPSARFLNISFSLDLPQKWNSKCVDVIKSKEFQELYGNKFTLTNEGSSYIANNKTGFKAAFGIAGSITGQGGDFIILDDPNNLAEKQDSVDVREEANRKFSEAISNRLNSMENSVIIVIQQRTHEKDVSGYILENKLGYTHLCIPVLFDPTRICETYIEQEDNQGVIRGELFWEDPRTYFEENMCPERFTPKYIADEMHKMREHAFQGQYQQAPFAPGGEIIKLEYWKPYLPEPTNLINPSTKMPVVNNQTGKIVKTIQYPKFEFILASLDPAFTEKQTNDPSGFTIWGIFLREPDKVPSAMLVDSFSKRLEIMGPKQEIWPGETYHDWKARTEPDWGLIETVNDRCKKYGVNTLLIESVQSQITLVQMMNKILLHKKYNIEAITVKLDKMARLNRVVPIFVDGQVYAPQHSRGLSKEDKPTEGVWKDFVKPVMRELAGFPNLEHDDLVDSTSQALWWLRSQGFLERYEEQFAKKEDRAKKYRQPELLYAI